VGTEEEREREREMEQGQSKGADWEEGWDGKPGTEQFLLTWRWLSRVCVPAAVVHAALPRKVRVMCTKSGV